MLPASRTAFLAVLAWAFACATAFAADLTVRVTDREGMPVQDVVVLARPTSDSASSAADQHTAVMDQRSRQFAPFVIAVHTGAAVMFANSDSVAHQVYSFSSPRQFELGLYRGQPRNPIVFDKPGIVVLGCNIHDNMLGYVYVTDAPHFGTTDASGEWRAALGAGDYAIEIWSPRLGAREPLPRSEATMIAGQPLAIDVRFKYPLAPAPKPVRDSRLRDY